MAKVIVSPEARTDLEEINSYIRDELLNPDAALKLMGDLKQTIQSLREFPERGTALSTILAVRTAHRFLLCGSYAVFYQVNGETVEVLRILNQRQNYLKALFL